MPDHHVPCNSGVWIVLSARMLPPPSLFLLFSLEVVQEDVALLALLAPISNHDAGAVDNLAGISLAVEDAETGPLAEELSIRHLDERDLVLRAQSDDELLVGLLLASLVQDTHVCLATIEGFGCLAQASGETIVDEGEFEDTYKAMVVRMDTSWLLNLDNDETGFGIPFRASRTDIDPEDAAASPETSTSSAAATGEVGSSPSDCVGE